MSVTFRLTGLRKTFLPIFAKWTSILRNIYPLFWQEKIFTLYSFVCTHGFCFVSLLIAFLNGYPLITSNVLRIQNKAGPKCSLCNYDSDSTCLVILRTNLPLSVVVLLKRLGNEEKPLLNAPSLSERQTKIVCRYMFSSRKSFESVEDKCSLMEPIFQSHLDVIFSGPRYKQIAMPVYITEYTRTLKQWIVFTNLNISRKPGGETYKPRHNRRWHRRSSWLSQLRLRSLVLRSLVEFFEISLRDIWGGAKLIYKWKLLYPFPHRQYTWNGLEGVFKFS